MNQKKKALVIVAHCDDAVLWMGGTIRHLRDWEWHIFSMCNMFDDIKTQSFNKSCQAFEATKFQGFNFTDYQNDGVFSKNKKETMKTALKDVINKEKYNYIFTHGTQIWNEYGHHDNHREVAEIAIDIAKEKELPLIQFCFKPIYEQAGVATVANKERANYYFQLNYEELKFKLQLIDYFPEEMGSLTSIGSPCPNPEAFEVSNTLPVPPFVKAK